MNKRLRAMVYVMILVVVAGGIYLWSQGRGADPLEKLDLKGYDISTTCVQVDKNILICNKRFDAYLCLDDVKVYLQKSKTVVDENGDERTFNEYETSTMSQLEKKSKKSKDIPVFLWMNSRGKVESVMMVETTYENNNASLAELDGLDPSSFNSANTVLVIDKKGMKLAPINYDKADAEKYEGLVKTFKFAKKVNFYHSAVTNFEDNKDKVLRNTKYTKVTFAQAKKRFADGKGNACVWINQNGNIYAVMTFVEETH